MSEGGYSSISPHCPRLSPWSRSNHISNCLLAADFDEVSEAWTASLGALPSTAGVLNKHTDEVSSTQYKPLSPCSALHGKACSLFTDLLDDASSSLLALPFPDITPHLSRSNPKHMLSHVNQAAFPQMAFPLHIL